MKKIRLAGCVIFNNQNKILILHRNKNGKQQWEIPGGKVNENETDELAAKRELFEETGCKVKIIKKLGEAEFIENNLTYFYIWFEAKITPLNQQIILEKGFDDFKYESLDDLQPFNKQLSKGTEKLLEVIKSL